MSPLRRLVSALLAVLLLAPLALGLSTSTALAGPPGSSGTTVDIAPPAPSNPDPARWSCPFVIVCFEVWPSYTEGDQTCTCWSYLNVLTGATWEVTSCVDS